VAREFVIFRTIFVYTIYNMVYTYNMDIRIRDVDPKLHRDFKLITVAQDTSIQQQVIRLIAEYVKDFQHVLPPEKKPGGTVRDLGHVKPRK